MAEKPHSMREICKMMKRPTITTVILTSALSMSLIANGLAGPPAGKGKNGASLAVTVTPDTFSERDAGATGTVTRENADTSVALTVTLQSNPHTQATVDASVEILAGEVSAEFAITPVNDNETDGDQQVTLSVSATDHSGASTSITVLDDEGLPNVEYRRTIIPLPSTGSILDFNDSGHAAGSYFDANDNQFGWIYDPAIAAEAVDVNTLNIEGISAEWVIRSCVGISNNGLVAGRVSPVDDASIAASCGYVLDYWGLYGGFPAQFYELPDDGYGWGETYARKVNDNGDIVGTFTQTDGISGIYFFNLGLRSGPAETELEIPDLPSISGAVMNNPPEGVPPTIGAAIIGQSSSEILFFTRGDTAAYYPPPEITREPAVNDFGGIAGRGAIEVPINKKKSEPVQVIYRDYVTEDYVEGYYGIVKSLNTSGTIMIRGGSDLTLYHDTYGFVDVASITTAGQFPVNVPYALMNNVGPDGFGQIAVTEYSNSVLQILTPVELAP